MRKGQTMTGARIVTSTESVNPKNAKNLRQSNMNGRMLCNREPPAIVQNQIMSPGLHGKRARASKRPRVALLIESSRAYGRGTLMGVAKYVRQHGAWSIFFQ